MLRPRRDKDTADWGKVQNEELRRILMGKPCGKKSLT
jgi:hypothetical protein